MFIQETCVFIFNIWQYQIIINLFLARQNGTITSVINLRLILTCNYHKFEVHTVLSPLHSLLLILSWHGIKHYLEVNFCDIDVKDSIDIKSSPVDKRTHRTKIIATMRTTIANVKAYIIYLTELEYYYMDYNFLWCQIL